jgi:hypothetical protein
MTGDGSAQPGIVGGSKQVVKRYRPLFSRLGL